MAAYFFDSSALVKRWIREAGTEWVRRASSSRAGNQVIVARLILPETASALAGRQRAGDIDPTRVDRALAVLRLELATRFVVVELVPPVLDRAADLARRHPLKAADAIHLAAALVVRDAAGSAVREPLVFVAPDLRLGRAAEAEGFSVEIPRDPDGG